MFGIIQPPLTIRSMQLTMLCLQFMQNEKQLRIFAFVINIVYSIIAHYFTLFPLFLLIVKLLDYDSEVAF